MATLMASLVGLVLMAGCAHTPSERTAERPPDSVLPPLVISTPVAAQVDNGAMARPSSATPRFSFRDTPLADALRLLFDGSGINLIVEDDITGRVTADFADTRPEQVLSTLLKTHGLTVTYGDGYARVSTERTRTFTFDYVAGAQHQEVWDEIGAQVAALLTPDSGKVSVSPLTGTLVVTDRPEHLDQVGAYLDTLREVVQRQVMIQARVIEVTLNDEFSLGIDYGLSARTLGIGGGPGNANPVLGGAPLTVGNRIVGQAALAQDVESILGGLKLGVFRTGDFSVLMEALHRQGQVNVLSSPRVATLNNRPARIKVTEQVPVISREFVIGQVDGSIARESFNVTFKDAGIELEVTPQVAADGTMMVRVHPLVTEVSGEVRTPDGLQILPILNERETDTVLLVRDGQSILLGGFIQNRRRESVTKVPLLGDLPWLGALFRRTTQIEDRVELVILLTPQLLNPDRIAEAVEDGLARVKHLARPFRFGLLGRTPFSPEVETPAGGYGMHLQPVSAYTNAPGGYVRVTRRGLARYADEIARRHLRDGDERQAEARWTEALRADPDFAEARFQLALLNARQGNTAAAVHQIQRLAQLTPVHPWGLNEVALALIQARSFDSAIRVLRLTMSRFPNQPELITNLGVAYLGKGRADLALQVFERAAGLTKPPLEADINRAELLIAAERLEEAEVLLRRSVGRIPNTNPEFGMRVRTRLMDVERRLRAIRPPASQPLIQPVTTSPTLDTPVNAPVGTQAEALIAPTATPALHASSPPYATP